MFSLIACEQDTIKVVMLFTLYKGLYWLAGNFWLKIENWKKKSNGWKSDHISQFMVGMVLAYCENMERREDSL